MLTGVNKAVTERRGIKLFSGGTLASSTPGRGAVWTTFFKQKSALDFANHSSDYLTFAKEHKADGRRIFIVATLPNFWSRYQTLPVREKSLYEVIEHNKPCKLHLDIEFDRRLNPSSDGQSMIRIFKRFLIDYILQKTGVSVAISDIVDLDSSTQSKFSRHLIVAGPRVESTYLEHMRRTLLIFRNNIECGAFVKTMCAEIKRIASTSRHALKSLLIFTRNSHIKSELSLFVDEAVYTRNRNFRLIGSSKRCHIESVSGGVFLRETGVRRRSSYSDSFSDFIATLVGTGCITDSPHTVTLSHPNIPITERHQHNNCQVVQASEMPNAVMSSVQWLQPKVEQIVKNWCRKTAPWYCWEQDHLIHSEPTDIPIHSPLYDANGIGRITDHKVYVNHIVFCVRGNRFCMNVARSHRSNGIYFVFDLRKSTLHQKCHDSNCMHFASPSIPFSL